jgi:hypothetical protein
LRCSLRFVAVLHDLVEIVAQGVCQLVLNPCFSARAPEIRFKSGRCSPEPSRECSSMFLTIANHRMRAFLRRRSLFESVQTLLLEFP